MSQANPNTWRSQLAAWRAQRVEIGISEVMYLFGLAFLFFGLWIWLGLGVSLATSGAVLIISSIINDLIIEARAARIKHV